MSAEGIAVSTGSIPVPPPIEWAVQIRMRLLEHEATIRSFGAFYILVGGVMVPFTLILVGEAFHDRGDGAGPDQAIEWAAMLFGLLIGIALMTLGMGLRRLRRWSRTPTLVFCFIGLIGFPIGTVLNGYLLYFLLSAKGAEVFSEEYRQSVVRTPHLRYTKPTILKPIAALFAAFLVVAIVSVLLRPD